MHTAGGIHWGMETNNAERMSRTNACNSFGIHCERYRKPTGEVAYKVAFLNRYNLSGRDEGEALVTAWLVKQNLI